LIDLQGPSVVCLGEVQAQLRQLGYYTEINTSSNHAYLQTLYCG